MQSREEKIAAIRYASEREFATAFFNHNDWDYQPCKFALPARPKTTYTPDFFDRRRGVYIEVIGSSSILYQRQEKYLLFPRTYPDLKYEMYTSKGKPLIFDDHGFTILSWYAAFNTSYLFQEHLTGLAIINPYPMTGSYNHRNKNQSLTTDQVRAIRSDNRRIYQIAKEMGISSGIIHQIKAGLTYRWVE